MFTISNNRKQGDNSFITAKGRPVILRPGRVLNFEDDELNDGLLRTMIGPKSPYKVLADGDDAQSMIDAANLRKSKKNGSPLVHGSTEPPDYQAGRDKPITIRDLKEKKAAGGPYPFDGPVDPPPRVPSPDDGKQPQQDPPGTPPKPEVTKDVFIKEEGGPSPAKALLAQADDLPWADLMTQATAVLGDKLPTRPGRKSIKDALTSLTASE
jgi:hypothetical protein